MKTTFSFFLSILISASGFAQNFTWLHGSPVKNVPGVYGTMGTAANGNDPGARHGSATWTDASGNLWLFGGEGYDTGNTICWLNDLWKYDLITKQWTWIRGTSGPNALGKYGTQGVASSTNDPGAREFPMCWTDASGNFWMYGGEGFGAVTISTAETLGDLWKYSPSNNQWTFVKGYTITNQPGVYGTKGTAAGTNLPPSRSGGGTWSDGSGKFWLFGGRGAFSGPNYLNDLWTFNPSTSEWTWISGSNTTNQVTVHGTLGTPNIANIPGGREFPGCWTDASGKMYLLGGKGRGASLLGWLNDMWRYDPGTNLWTWINGSNLNNQATSYGTLGVPSSGTAPGGRYASAYWKDKDGNFWMFGGEGYASSLGDLNDLFKYDPALNQWAYMKGSTSINKAGIYGTMGVPHINNVPGGRYFNTSWHEVSDAFYLIGGRGYDSTATWGDMNDLWRYIPPCNPDSILSTSQKLCTGNSVTLTAYNQFSSVVKWYASSSSTAVVGNGTVLVTPVLTAVGNQSVYSFYASSNSCTMAPLTMISVTVNPIPTISVSGPTAGCEGGQVSLTATGGSTYVWSNGSTGSTIQMVLNGPQNPTIICFGTDPNGCTNSASLTIKLNAKPLLSIAGPTATCEGTTITFTATGAASYTWSHGSNTSTSNVVPTGTLFITTLLGESAEGCENSTTYSTIVNPPPTLSTSINAPAKFCTNYTATITATGASSYVWSGGETTSVIVVNPSVTTTYTVTGIDINGCVNTAKVTQTTTICTGLQEDSDEEFSIFPNPNNGRFSVKVDLQYSNSTIMIYNTLGGLVSKEKLEKETTRQLDLPEGVYFIQINFDTGKSGTKKLIVR